MKGIIKISFFTFISIVCCISSIICCISFILLFLFDRFSQYTDISFFYYYSLLIASIVSGLLARKFYDYGIAALIIKFIAIVTIIISFIFLCFMVFLFVSSLPLHPSHALDLNFKEAKAKTTVQTLKVALDRYKDDIGHYPLTNDSHLVANEITGFKSSPDALEDMSVQNANWHGPYYSAPKKDFYIRQRNQALLDPWGSPYNFNFSNNQQSVWSSGPNRINENGNNDDISIE